MSVSGSGTGADHAGRESETERERETGRGSGTKKGGAIVGDLMMSHPVELQRVSCSFEIMNENSKRHHDKCFKVNT